MWKVKYLETSAKNNININELFEEIFKLEKKRELSLQPKDETDKKKKRKCCICWTKSMHIYLWNIVLINNLSLPTSYKLINYSKFDWVKFSLSFLEGNKANLPPNVSILPCHTLLGVSKKCCSCLYATIEVECLYLPMPIFTWMNFLSS